MTKSLKTIRDFWGALSEFQQPRQFHQTKSYEWIRSFQFCLPALQGGMKPESVVQLGASMDKGQ